MTTFTNGHALLIGVGGDLPFTVNDAEGIGGILADQERCAYPQANVETVTGPAASRKGILDAFDRLAKRSDAKSTAIVFFSGHGYQVKTEYGDHYYLMPTGYDVNALKKTAINGAEFAEKLRRINAERMLVLLDCCHAGGFDEGTAKAPEVELVKSPIPLEAQNLLAKGSGRVIIASSRANEKSLAGRPYSAFTLAIIEAFSGLGAAKEDGFVRWTDLVLYASEMVPQRTKKKQHPVIPKSDDDFVLAYYAAGATKSKGLPFTAPVEIESQPGAFARLSVKIEKVRGNKTVVTHSPGAIVNSRGDINQTINSGTRGQSRSPRGKK